MSEDITRFLNPYIKEVDTNIYEIDYENIYTLNSVGQNLRKLIVKEKQDFVKLEKKLDSEDLVLVRTMKKLPEDLIYHSFTNQGAYTTMKNPFRQVLEDFGLSGKELEEYELVCPIYRDTVHFSVNGIVSNVWYSSDFNRRNVVVIEPLKDHLNEKLVNLNPVDTMIDVGTEEEPIKENATIILEKNYYENLTPGMKAKLKNQKIFLFDLQKLNYIEDKDDPTSYLDIITDLVLCYIGILPQHTISQSVLYPENCSIEGTYYSDKKYLKMFTDLVDKVSTEKLGISYYNLTEEIKEKRQINSNFPGVFHFDTKYFEEEVEQNRNNRKTYIKKYLDYIQEELGLEDEMANYIYNRYCRYVDRNYSKDSYGSPGHTFMSLINYEEAEEFIRKVSPERLLEITKEFNISEKNKLTERANKYQLLKLFEDETIETEDMSKKIH